MDDVYRVSRTAVFLLLVLVVSVLGCLEVTAATAQPMPEPARLLGLGSAINEGGASLADEGVHPFLAYYGVFLSNPVGGRTQSAAYSHEIIFGVNFDLDKLANIPGASFTISGVDAVGTNLSDSIGNLFYVSESYVTPTIFFYQLYWKQDLFDKSLELYAGRMTAADLFASLPAFGWQVSGGINGNPTSIFLNAPFTSSPDATWAAALKYRPGKDFYLATGIYQATQRLGDAAYHGVDFSIRPGDGVLLMAQAGWEPTFFGAAESPMRDQDGKRSSADDDFGLPGTYVVGGYYSNFSFSELNGPGVQHNAYGLYAMAQQMVWRSSHDPDLNFSVWGGATYSPQQAIAQMPFMGFAGTIWQGAIPGRGLDQLLFTYLVGTLSHDYAESVVRSGGERPTAEHVLELSYAIYLTPNYTIQPDIQYVIRPGGSGDINNALVIGLQFVANF